ncbi:vitamin B12 dependent-methionine synthase activation domain-containing protein [uncultured Clostridium sp.]|uniref:vitamin B12 dependent-methionine synthase activation domain-containing protein n=1 Tax=uncultured Clostridium sp. TaxID=59620 RepID=UPI0026166F3F|nr:vitamin B12 dependent-methionine synthase activation domain-containing protein [uncultured Clostridium sp.]
MCMDNLEISIDEVLRYLGYKGQELDQRLLDDINKIRKESKAFLRPKKIYNFYNIEKSGKEIKLLNTIVSFKGEDIYNLLKKSHKIILIAVTLGNDIERLIRKYEKISMRDALILDACATTAIEEYIDKLELKLKKEYLREKENFTLRYSPGYGDLSLGSQRDIINILDCERRIGLNLSESLILFPRKSVTAILGIIEDEKEKKSCLKCSNYSNCIYRKEGDICGC